MLVCQCCYYNFSSHSVFKKYLRELECYFSNIDYIWVGAGKKNVTYLKGSFL